VNYSKTEKNLKIDLSAFKGIGTKATLTQLTGDANAKNSFESPSKISPSNSELNAPKRFSYSTQPMSLTIIRIKGNK
jgi:alpha-L-arabinofuranosidase